MQEAEEVWRRRDDCVRVSKPSPRDSRVCALEFFGVSENLIIPIISVLEDSIVIGRFMY